ncbi:hypothetical protein ACQR0Y_13190 [Bradyrhizobium oligotrophicum]|uniref:hypothetical protein n=1 Tax=Bradyrhizobium oligotrophicum TaxID=44255 RepID=UPI003EBFFFEE
MHRSIDQPDECDRIDVRELNVGLDQPLGISFTLEIGIANGLHSGVVSQPQVRPDRSRRPRAWRSGRRRYQQRNRRRSIKIDDDEWLPDKRHFDIEAETKPFPGKAIGSGCAAPCRRDDDLPQRVGSRVKPHFDHQVRRRYPGPGADLFDRVAQHVDKSGENLADRLGDAEQRIAYRAALLRKPAHRRGHHVGNAIQHLAEVGEVWKAAVRHADSGSEPQQLLGEILRLLRRYRDQPDGIRLDDFERRQLSRRPAAGFDSLRVDRVQCNEKRRIVLGANDDPLELERRGNAEGSSLHLRQIDCGRLNGERRRREFDLERQQLRLIDYGGRKIGRYCMRRDDARDSEITADRQRERKAVDVSDRRWRPAAIVVDQLAIAGRCGADGKPPLGIDIEFQTQLGFSGRRIRPVEPHRRPRNRQIEPQQFCQSAEIERRPIQLWPFDLRPMQIQCREIRQRRHRYRRQHLDSVVDVFARHRELETDFRIRRAGDRRYLTASPKRRRQERGVDRPGIERDEIEVDAGLDSRNSRKRQRANAKESTATHSKVYRLRQLGDQFAARGLDQNGRSKLPIIPQLLDLGLDLTPALEFPVGDEIGFARTSVGDVRRNLDRILEPDLAGGRLRPDRDFLDGERVVGGKALDGQVTLAS